MSAPLIQNVLYPGEDGLWIHQAEELQGPTDASPGSSFSPKRYIDFTGWDFREELVVKPPSRRRRASRIPKEFEAEIFTGRAFIFGEPTEGKVAIGIRRAESSLAQDYDELFAELWALDTFGQRRHLANLRWTVETSVDPTL
jgi:hypothetical protein